MKALFFSILAGCLVTFSAYTSQSLRTNQDCNEQFNQLITATQAAASLSTKDKTGLTGKAQTAQNAYNTGKVDDGCKKLNDYQVKLNQLEATAKISGQDASLLQQDLMNTQNCIGCTTLQ